MNKPICIVVSGPSGAGKTTIINAFLKKYFNKATFVVYDITREKRNNEIDGVDYNFITQEQYERKKNNGEYAICYDLLGSSRGIDKQTLKIIENEGKTPIIVANYQNLVQIQRIFNVIPIFITVKNKEILKDRLTERYKNVDKHELENRIKSTEITLKTQKYYKFVIVNEDLQEAIKQFEQIFQNEVLKNK